MFPLISEFNSLSQGAPVFSQPVENYEAGGGFRGKCEMRLSPLSLQFSPSPLLRLLFEEREVRKFKQEFQALTP